DGPLVDPAILPAGKRGEPEDFTPERCLTVARRAVGIPGLPVEVVNIAFWTRAAQVAERFRAGRVFLTGDAGIGFLQQTALMPTQVTRMHITWHGSLHAYSKAGRGK